MAAYLLFQAVKASSLAAPAPCPSFASHACLTSLQGVIGPSGSGRSRRSLTMPSISAVAVVLVQRHGFQVLVFEPLAPSCTLILGIWTYRWVNITGSFFGYPYRQRFLPPFTAY
ncbi:hypothetical protein LZ30DRAFT_166430 [Colletotrichum cereale]|nr:hypothetical protein LZ30DRAFT_166430 [Colletotrichum cereale]